MAYNALATSDALIAKNPALVQRMVNAILKGVLNVKASRADPIATLLTHGQSNAQAIGTEYDALIDSLTTTGTMPPEAQALDILARRHAGRAQDPRRALGRVRFQLRRKSRRAVEGGELAA